MASDHRRSSATDPVVEWYRPRLFGRLLLAWLAASGLLGVGSVGVALAWDTTGRVPESWRPVCLAAGVLGTVLGAVGGIFGIIKLVSQDDRYLLVRRSGLEVAEGGRPPRAIAWRQLQAVQVARRRVELRLADGDTVRLGVAYQGVSAAALADRLTELRRKALLGALHPERPRRR